MSVLGVVAKMERVDPDAARELARIAVWEWMAAEADAVRPVIAKAENRATLARSDDMRRALVRSFVEKRASGVGDAELVEHLHHAAYLTHAEGYALGVVSKAAEDNPDTPYYDARGASGPGTNSGSFAPRTTLGRAARVLDRFVNGPPKTRKSTNKKTGEVREVDEHWHKRNQGLQNNREKITRQAGEFASDWNKIPEGMDRATYHRMQAGGKALEQLGNPNVSAVGTLTRLAGEIGPEAERVLGPGLRRTAYRYRGTERTPDRGLRESLRPVRNPDAVHEAINTQPYLDKIANSSDPFARSLRARAGHTEHKAVAMPNASPDSLALHIRADMATNYLMDQLADPQLAEVNIAAGRIPPSHGVLIDREGDIRTEAIGFNGDHYLPFDLKNLKSMAGGQYARTRVTGGPTTEDIYTGLVSGARAMTVVSNSGVFTVEFDPDLRGGRRLGDKARAMVKRYGEILEAINGKPSNAPQGGKLMRGDLSPEDVARIRYEAYSDPSVNWDKTRGEQLAEQRLRQERTKATVINTDELRQQIEAEVIDEWTRADMRAQGSAFKEEVQERYEEALRNELGGRVQEERLDGPGYSKALQALRQEFPQFIRRVTFETLPEYEEGRNAREKGRPRRKVSRRKDAGYVEPGRQQPKAFSATDRYAPERLRGGAGSRSRSQDTDEEATTSGGGVLPRSSGLTPDAITRSAALAPKARQGAAGKFVGFEPKPSFALTKLREDKLIASQLEKKFLAQMGDLKGALSSIPAPGERDEYALSPTDYVLDLTEKPREAAKALLEGDLDIQKLVTGLEYWEDVAETEGFEKRLPAIKHLREEIGNLVGLTVPFAEPAGSSEDDMDLASPDVLVPLPQPYPAIVELGTDPANYEMWEARAHTDAQDIAAHLGRDIPSLIEAIEETSIGYQVAGNDEERARAKAELRAMQIAWAFERGRQLAETARKIIPAGAVAADPKEPVSQRDAPLHLTREQILDAFPADHPLLDFLR